MSRFLRHTNARLARFLIKLRHYRGFRQIRYNASMAERNLQIVRFIGATPSVAYCDVCRLTFRTRQEFITDSEKAKQQLLSDFEKHECKPEPGAVDEALTHIR